MKVSSKRWGIREVLFLGPYLMLAGVHWFFATDWEEGVVFPEEPIWWQLSLALYLISQVVRLVVCLLEQRFWPDAGVNKRWWRELSVFGKFVCPPVGMLLIIVLVAETEESQPEGWDAVLESFRDPYLYLFSPGLAGVFYGAWSLGRWLLRRRVHLDGSGTSA